MKILGTGLNGLVGTRVVELLSSKYEFQNISRSTGVDISDYSSVLKAVSASDSPVLIHAAAYTDVKTAEIEKDLKEESAAYKINVIGTQNVSRACSETGKKIIFLSTDLVIGGDDMPEGGFREDAKPNPLSWYAVTKYEAEKKIQELLTPWVIMRIAYPYRSDFEKMDFVRFFKKMLSDNNSVNVLEDRLFTPTFIDDVASAIDMFIEKDSTGLFHGGGSQILSMYKAVLLIAEKFGLDKSLVGKTTREKFLVGRAPEPFSSALNSDKIAKLGVRMKTFEEGLVTIISQGLKYR